MTIFEKTRTSLLLAALILSPFATAQEVKPDPAIKPAATAPGASAKTDTPQLQSRDERYRVAPGDSFDVTFELSPEFNQTGVSIQPDGFVTLKTVGEVYVQGETVPELTNTLRAAYGKVLHQPIVTVTLKDFEKPYFVADGQVGRPGKYDLRGDVTLTQAIAIAGGFKDEAKGSQVLLFRRVSDEWMEAKIFNVKKMHKTLSLKEDPTLHPGDMVFVPKNALSKIDKFFPSAQMGSMLRPN
ncbi:MAG TPA: polysaccharide biosynthesis/export family protein [Verrucomicrobiae bacterium]|jgi:polysaccharide biosynthesis/export protein|nr:polysaccharide biosynthesis/export family protein [Verrucomicrobiae bacterium]